MLEILAVLIILTVLHLFHLSEVPIETDYLTRMPKKVSLSLLQDFPGGSDGKVSACNVRDLGLIPRLRRSPGGRHGNPLQYSHLKNPHEHRSLVGYSSRGCKELDITKHTHS